MTTLSRILTKGLIKTGRIAEIKTKVVDKPGQLNHLLQIIADTGANIMSVDHKREDKEAEVNVCVVSMVLETRNTEHVAQIHEALKNSGYMLLGE